jgi:exodeoxyribonuclease-3
VDDEDDAPTFLRAYGTRAYATSTARKGYSGTAMYIRDGPWATMRRVEATRVGAGAFDDEGRVLTAELDACFVVNAYAPNSGADLKRLSERVDVWERAIRAHVRALEARGKPVIYCGDLNVAHEAIDLWGRHAENEKSAGFTREERDAMTRLLDECALIDTFRAHRPDAQAFTYWSYRAGAREKNRGWRLDYILASARLRDAVVDAYALPDVLGSDHCPVGVRIALP